MRGGGQEAGVSIRTARIHTAMDDATCRTDRGGDNVDALIVEGGF